MTRLAAVALLRRPSGLNKTEGRYHDRLVLAHARGEVAAFRWHEVTLVLGPDCRYTPDVLVILPDGHLQLHEVKGGFKREDAMVKLRVAARQFPWFYFVLAEEQDRVWHVHDVVP